jgi:hypothetical protein
LSFPALGFRIMMLNADGWGVTGLPVRAVACLSIPAGVKGSRQLPNPFRESLLR